MAASVGKKSVARKMSAVDVLLAEGCVGFGDADQLDLGVGGETVEEPANVAVDEADDCDADGCGLCDCLVWCEGGGEDRGSNDRGSEEEFAAKQIFHGLISPKTCGPSLDSAGAPAKIETCAGSG